MNQKLYCFDPSHLIIKLEKRYTRKGILEKGYTRKNTRKGILENTRKGILEKIHKLQKQYCRIISFSSYRAHSNPLFRSLNILTIYSIYKLQLAVYMFRQMKNLLPGINPFNFSQPSHKYNTRHKSELHIDRCRTKMRQSTVQFQGPKLWNSLPQNIVNEPSLGAFKNSIKNFLVS